jgi:hypothetical protein
MTALLWGAPALLALRYLLMIAREVRTACDAFSHALDGETEPPASNVIPFPPGGRSASRQKP